MSHIAVYQSSARMARLQRAAENGHGEEVDKGDEAPPPSANKSASLEDSAINENDLSQMSLLNISDDSSQETSSRRKNTSPQNSRAKIATEARAIPHPLRSMTNLFELEAQVDPKLHQSIVLNRIENRCREINANFECVIEHLKECTKQVVETSSNNLECLLYNVGLTCDKVDDELKAFHHLMTKCDELTTKLSAAVSFRDEIKTLRKSIETLEYLYKTKPQRAPAEVARSVASSQETDSPAN